MYLREIWHQAIETENFVEKIREKQPSMNLKVVEDSDRIVIRFMDLYIVYKDGETVIYKYKSSTINRSKNKITILLPPFDSKMDSYKIASELLINEIVG